MQHVFLGNTSLPVPRIQTIVCAMGPLGESRTLSPSPQVPVPLCQVARHAPGSWGSEGPITLPATPAPALSSRLGEPQASGVAPPWVFSELILV